MAGHLPLYPGHPILGQTTGASVCPRPTTPRSIAHAFEVAQALFWRSGTDRLPCILVAIRDFAALSTFYHNDNDKTFNLTDAQDAAETMSADGGDDPLSCRVNLPGKAA